MIPTVIVQETADIIPTISAALFIPFYWTSCVLCNVILFFNTESAKLNGAFGSINYSVGKKVYVCVSYW